jgi:hypothetical protein
MEDGEVQKDIGGKTGAFNEELNKFTYVSKDKKTTISLQCDSNETMQEFLKLN